MCGNRFSRWSGRGKPRPQDRSARDRGQGPSRGHARVSTSHACQSVRRDQHLAHTPRTAFYAGGTQVQVTAVPAPGWHFAGWTGEVPGSDLQQAIVMDAAKSLEAVFTESMPLQTGRTDGLDPPNLQSVPGFTVARTDINVLVPPDAAETGRSDSNRPSAEEVDLYVQLGREVWSEPGDAGERPRIHADFESDLRWCQRGRSRSRGNRLHL